VLTQKWSCEGRLLLQIGTRSPRELYITDVLATALPNVRVQDLPGEAHEAMTIAPTLYAQAVSRFSALMN
jgi:hypothetical protein